jgi:hypothetical protein
MIDAVANTVLFLLLVAALIYMGRNLMRERNDEV